MINPNLFVRMIDEQIFLRIYLYDVPIASEVHNNFRNAGRIMHFAIGVLLTDRNCAFCSLHRTILFHA